MVAGAGFELFSLRRRMCAVLDLRAKTGSLDRFFDALGLGDLCKSVSRYGKSV